MTVTVAFLCRYPVKGLSPEPLTQAELSRGEHFPGDRLFAIENGPSGFDPAAAVHLPKFKFLMLMRNAGLARFLTRYDEATDILSIWRGETVLAEGNLATAAGRRAIEQFCETEFAAEMRGPAQLLRAPPGFRFMDSRAGFVSLLNLASVSAIAGKSGRRGLDPRRFRANVGLAGLPPWGEFDLVGQEIVLGTARLRITKRTDRCAATQVDPSTGKRDIDIVSVLEQNFDHNDCGVYAEVTQSGLVKTGDIMAQS